ncbi:MAG: hypothetical protein V4648_06225 [Bacteroidota bacterium]
MDKTKVLTFTVITLLLLNIGTLGFLYISASKEHRPPPGHGPEGRSKPREIIIEKLHFDAIQIKQYDQLIKKHQSDIRATEDNIRDSKNELYLQLNETITNEKAKDSLINALSLYQKQIETIHFNHFQDIKKLCKKEQLYDFSALTEELSRLFSKPQRRRDD